MWHSHRGSLRYLIVCRRVYRKTLGIELPVSAYLSKVDISIPVSIFVACKMGSLWPLVMALNKNIYKKIDTEKNPP